MLPHRASGRLLLAVYAAVGLVILVSEVAGSALADVFGWFTIPLLAELLLVSTDSPRPRPVVLFASGLLAFAAGAVLADILAEGTAVPVEVALNGLGMLLLLLALLPLRRESIIAARPSWLLGYAMFGLVVVFAVRGAGELFIPLLVYGALAMAVALLATGLGATAGLGGVLVLLSHALAVMHVFTPGWDRPAVDFWVQLTSIFGMAMLALGVLGRWQAGTYTALELWSLRRGHADVPAS